MLNIISKISLIIVVVLIVLFFYKTITAPHITSTAVAISTIEGPSSNETDDKTKIQLIVENYLKNNPEVIIQAVGQLQKRNMQETGNKVSEYIKNNKLEIENILKVPIIGNVEGDITITYFYDYNCSYCKENASYIQQLIKVDPNVKVLLRPSPILGNLSDYIARVVLVVCKIAPNKCGIIHDGLIQMQNITQESVEKLLLSNNFNVETIREEINKTEIRNLINTNIDLMKNLKIQGVPAYIINGQLISVLIDLVQLQKIIDDIRSQKVR